MTTPIRLLIAGCGDLGLRVAHQLLIQSNACVWGLRRSIVDDTLHPPGFSWHVADLSKPATLTALPSGITHILFSAAPNARTETEYRDIYFNGLQNIVQSASSPFLKRILFISSTAVYGEHGDEWVDEQTPLSPKNFNGRVLLESEQWLSQFGRNHGLTTINLRLSGIYGPGRTHLLEKLKLGQAGAPTFPIHWVNRIHVEDAASAIIHLMDISMPMDTYLITDSTPLPMRTLYEALAKDLGGPVPPEDSAPRFVGSKRLSNARLVASGFKLKWPDCREGYASIIQSG